MNTFYGIDEGSVFLSSIHIFQSHKSFVNYSKVIKVILLLQSQKKSPRIKNIAIKYHHFLSFIKNNIIQICYIDKREQTADIFTKPLKGALFIYLWIKSYKKVLNHTRTS